MISSKKSASIASSSAGRPRSFDEEVVLDQVVDLFWQKGFSSTTTRDLEHHLGLNQSSIYSAFGSKNNLLMLALDRYERLMSEQLLCHLDRADAGLNGISRFFLLLSKIVTSDNRHGCLLINLMAEEGGVTTELKNRTRTYRKRVKNGFLHCLEQAPECKALESPVLEQRADLLLGLTLGFNIAVRGGATKKELNSQLGAVQMLLDSWRSE